MKWIVALAIALICGPALADRQSFAPVDEADSDPDLAAFRADLLAKVTARDLEAVIAAACPDIYLSHGGEGGPEEFRANLVAGQNEPDNDQRESYWAALQDTLSQPGYFDDQGEFWMPHQWQITLPASLDPAITYFVAGENVSLRQTGSRSAPIVGLISHEIVIVPDFQTDTEYQRVLLTDGTRGFMHRDFLWSMIGHRAALVKSDAGDWQLCTFVAGD